MSRFLDPTGAVESGLRRPTRAERVLLWALFVFSVLVIFTRPAPSALPPTSSMDVADHVSHVGLTLLFARSGLDVFRKPRASSCDRKLRPGEALAASRRAGIPVFIAEDYCGVSSLTPRAFHLNWPKLPSPYPVGLHAYTLPEATAFVLGASEHAIASLSLFKFTVVALALCTRLTRIYPATGLLRFTAWPTWLVLIFFWSLHGIYDGIAILCMLMGVERAREEPLKAWAWLSLAVLLHYRALFFVPIMIWACWRAARAAAGGSRRAQALFGAVTLANALSLGVLTIQYPAFGRLPATNPLLEPRYAVVFILMVVPLLALAWRERSLLWCVSVAWIAGVLLLTRQVMPWHFLSLCPLLAVAKLSDSPRRIGVGTHAFLVLTGVVMHVRALE